MKLTIRGLLDESVIIFPSYFLCNSCRNYCSNSFANSSARLLSSR